MSECENCESWKERGDILFDENESLARTIESNSEMRNENAIMRKFILSLKPVPSSYSIGEKLMLIDPKDLKEFEEILQMIHDSSLAVIGE